MSNIITPDNKLINNLSSLYENSPFIVAYKTPDLKFAYCNAFLRDFAECSTLDAIQGKSDQDFRWEKFADLYARHELDALNNNVYLALSPSYDVDGNEVMVSLYRTPYFDENNVPQGVLSHAYILRDRQALELSNLLKKTEPASDKKTYTLDKKVEDIALSQKERECLFYYIRRKSYKTIGHVLDISPRTVEAHLDNVQTKFGGSNRTELVDRAIEVGYLYDLPTSLLDKVVQAL